MSSITKNRLVIVGTDSEKILNLFTSYDKTTKENYLDFEKIAPVPKELLIENESTEGSKALHKWRLDNWGCKSEAFNCLFLSPTMIYFDTSNSSAKGLICTFSKRYPQSIFHYDFAYEAAGEYAGSISYQNGNELMRSDFESGSKDAFEMYFDLFGEDENYVYDEIKDTYKFTEDKAEMT